MTPPLDFLADPARVARESRGLAAVLRGFFRRALGAVSVALRRVLGRGLVPGQPPSLAAFVRPLAEAASPHLLRPYQRGAASLPSPGGFARLRPEVLVAIDQASLSLAQSTLETARGEVGTAVERLRGALREGMALGEALPELSARVREIFADPARARRIAVTEVTRAVHAGWLLAARASGVRKKVWKAAPGCCDLCKRLAALGAIPLEQPFHVSLKGGAYAVTMAPPAHPGCSCSVAAVDDSP